MTEETVLTNGGTGSTKTNGDVDHQKNRLALIRFSGHLVRDNAREESWPVSRVTEIAGL